MGIGMQIDVWDWSLYYTPSHFLSSGQALDPAHSLLLLSSRSKNSISEMTNGRVWRSGVKSGCLESEWVRVGGTWLQLMCCTVSHHCVPNFGRWGWIGDWRFGGDFVVKDRSQTKMTRREIQVVEQEEDLRDKCSERTMLKISWDLN